MPLTRTRHSISPFWQSLVRPVFSPSLLCLAIFFSSDLLLVPFLFQLRCVEICAPETPVTITRCLFLVLVCDPKATRLDDQHEMERKVGTCKCLLAIFARLETTTDAPVLQSSKIPIHRLCLPSFLHVNGEPPMDGDAMPEKIREEAKYPSER